MINELFANKSKLNMFIQQLRLNRPAYDSFRDAFQSDDQTIILNQDMDSLPF